MLARLRHGQRAVFPAFLAAAGNLEAAGGLRPSGLGLVGGLAATPGFARVPVHIDEVAPMTTLSIT